MSECEIHQLELLAELDCLSESLSRWEGLAPEYQPARACSALVRRLVERLGAIRVRLDAPLVVATLGGTGVGKSALVNALVGGTLVETGKSRPTTSGPILVCRPDLSPEVLGIDPRIVEVVHHENPSTRDLVLIDCPDPDTTEAIDAADTNLTRLRQILPHCDVVIVVTTQQKYRSARVAEELTQAAVGARLVFVETHADRNEDIREDWRRVLGPKYAPGHIFFVDSMAALADAERGLQPRGEFAALVDLLTRQLAGSAAARIRRANLLDLVGRTLDACGRRLDEALPAIKQLENAIQEQRARLSGQLSAQILAEFTAARRQWEGRLLGEIVSRWGFSPFAWLLRLYHGLGGLLFRGLILRARTPTQMALWGAVEGVRSWQSARRRRRVESTATRAVVGCWDSAELRSAALVIDGYALQAGLLRDGGTVDKIFQEAADATSGVADSLADQFQSLVSRAARQHTQWFIRYPYEFLLLIALAGLFFRPAKNFFYDSWLKTPAAPLLGLDFYVLSAFWLAVWCGVLLWTFVGRLRRGLKQEMNQLAADWAKPTLAGGVFAGLENQCRRIEAYRNELARLKQHVTTLASRVTTCESTLGDDC